MNLPSNKPSPRPSPELLQMLKDATPAQRRQAAEIAAKLMVAKTKTKKA